MGNKRLVRRVVYLAVAGAVATGALIIGTATSDAKTTPPVDRKTVIVPQTVQPTPSTGTSADTQSELVWT